jgi:hypothetical protein
MMGGDGAGRDHFHHPALPVLSSVAHHLAAAGGVADHHQVAQVELFDELGEVAGVCVHVVAGVRLRGAAVAAAVVRDRPVTVVGEELELDLPGVGAERPAVAEDHRLPFALVGVVDLRSV